MRINADRPDLRDDIESAYAVETNAFHRGVACPDPVAYSDGRCLTEVEGRLVRVHRWYEAL